MGSVRKADLSAPPARHFLTAPADEHSRFVLNFKQAIASVPAIDLKGWINMGWRECLAASWIIASKPDSIFRDQIAKKLLASETRLQGQGLCVATARYQDARAGNDLEVYLQTYLPVRDREYDQVWALGALSWLDDRLGTSRAKPFHNAAENWQIIVHGSNCGSMKPTWGIEHVKRAMGFLDSLQK